MRFVFEQEQPFLILTIDVDGGLHRAGVDLLGLIQVAQHAGGLQVFRADGGHIHHAQGLVFTAQFVSE